MTNVPMMAGSGFVPIVTRTDGAAVSRDVATILGDSRIVVVDNFLTTAHQTALRRGITRRWSDDEYQLARVGSGQDAKLQPEIRSDRVLWLDESNMNRAEQQYVTRLDTLRARINRELYLGLVDWEGHLAVYPRGAFYRRHLDRFQRDGRRTVSTVLYLNETWTPGMGGELRVWSGATVDSEYVDVAPLNGRLVVFLSGEIFHEVLPSNFERKSITGWFRTRSTA